MKYRIDFDIGYPKVYVPQPLKRIEFNSKSKDREKLMKRAFKVLDKVMGDREYTIYYWWWIQEDDDRATV